jgi:hypothetical protein
MLETVYRHKAASCTCVFERFKRFREGHENRKHDPRNRWPSIAWNLGTLQKFITWQPETIKWPSNWWRTNCVSPNERICQILHENLGTRIICVKSVRISRWTKGTQSHNLWDFTQTCHTSPHFTDCTITVDEWWVFQYVPKTKHQSREWRMQSSLRPKTFCWTKSRIKIMIIASD